MAAGSAPLFPGCYLQWMAQLQRVEPSARGPVARGEGAAGGARLHRPGLGQGVEGDGMDLDGRRYPATERDQQQNVANLVRRAAVGERAVDVDAKLVGTPDRRRHRDRGQRFGLERQRGTAPDI